MNEYKICLLGLAGSGCTSILHKYVYNAFFEDYMGPIEDTFIKQVRIEGELCNLELIDLFYIRNYTNFNDEIIRTSDSFIIVFSLTNRESFNEIRNYYNLILRIREIEYFPCVIVGNKVDLNQEFVISNEEIQNFINEFNFVYVESSVKTDFNINNIFIESYRLLIRDRPPPSQISDNFIYCGFYLCPNKCKIN